MTEKHVLRFCLISLGTVVEVGDKAKDHNAKETCQPASNEIISELLRHRPALHPTWK